MQLRKGSHATPPPVLPPQIVGEQGARNTSAHSPISSEHHTPSLSNSAHCAEDDHLAPSRGVIWAIILSAAIWGGIIMAVVLWRVL